MTSFSVASWNVGDAGLGRDLMAITRTANVVCLQEAADRDAMMNAFTHEYPSWVLFRVDVPGGHHSPVLVDTGKAGAPVSVTAHHAVDATRICPKDQKPKGAGPPVIKPKVITDVELANGVHLLNTHMIPSVTMSKAALKNKPTRADPRGEFEWKARRQHFRDHMDAIVATVRAIDGPVILTADFNAEPDFELMAPLHDEGFVGWTVKPTHDTRSIDHVVFLPHRGTTWSATTVLPTASDHNAVVSTFEQEPVVPPLLTPPYAGPAKFHGSKTNKPINRLVIHATVSPCEPGAAKAIARYFRETVTRPSSAHFVIDPDESFQVVYDSIVAYHAPPNEHSLGFELCFMPVHDPNGMWREDMHHRMILRAARLVAEAAVLYDVPIVKLDAADLKAGKRGICGHVDVSEAFHQTCVTADTPVLCADLTWRPAGDLVEGDELIGFDAVGLGDQRKLRRSVVTHNHTERDALLRVNTARGSVRCNAQHPWLVHRGKPGKRGAWQWVRADELRPEDVALYVAEPWEVDRSWEAGWLAGMYDGEGHMTIHNAPKSDGRANKHFSLGLAQRESETSERMLLALKSRGFEPCVVLRAPRSDALRGIHGQHVLVQATLTSRAAVMRALGMIRPPRLMVKADQVWEGGSVYKSGQKVEIHSIEPAGTGAIACLSTSTETYIAGGFAMHNSHWDPGHFPWDGFITKVQREADAIRTERRR